MSNKINYLDFKLDFTNYDRKMGSLIRHDPINIINVNSPLRNNYLERTMNPNPGQYGAFGPGGKPTGRW